MFFLNCTAGNDCEDLNFYAGFAEFKPTMDAINAWNRNKRFGNAYLDSDLDAVIEFDVNLEYGVSRDNLDAAFGLWELVLQQFADHIGYRTRSVVDQSTTMMAKPSQPLVPTVCSAVARSRGWLPIKSKAAREPRTLASVELRIDHLAVADDVVENDHRARTGEPDRPVEVGGVAGLVGVDEDQVERPCSRFRPAGSVSAAAPRWSSIRSESPARLMFSLRDRGVGRLVLERHQTATGRQRAGHADGRVAAQRADLEDAPCPGDAHQQVEELALRRRHVDGRSPAAALAASTASSVGSEPSSRSSM